MKFIFGNVALSAWGEVCMCSQIDEKENEIEKLIIYTDHGDDYLIVKTKDGKIYKYGYFLNLKFSPINYIRKPVLFRKEDEMSYISNKIFFDIYGDNGHGFIDRMTSQIVEDSEDRAKAKFRILGWDMPKYYNSGVMYHCKKYKEIVKRYLEKNGINTEENLKKLDDMVFDTSYYGIDGIAGKIDITGQNWICGDTVKYAYSNGKRIRLKRRFVGSDEWGESIYRWKI